MEIRICLLLIAAVLIKKGNFCTTSSCTKQVTTTKSAETDKTEWFSYSQSPVELLYLTSLEKDLFPIIKKYVVELKRKPELFFKRYIADYESSSMIALNSWNHTKPKQKNMLVPANPLWSFRMIRRFVKHIPKIKNVLLSDGNAELLEVYKQKVPASFVWPSQKDVDDSMDNLLNVHFVYDLNLTEFANGIIANVVTNANLSAIQCFEISKYALRNNKQYTLALEWLEIAEKKALDVNRHPILDKLKKKTIWKLFKDITTQHDTDWRKERPTQHNLFKYIAKIDSEYILTSQKAALQFLHQNKGAGALHISPDDVTAFSTLCKGGNLQTEKERSELYCWYEFKTNPAWYVNSQKMELHSQDPYIFQVYDFIGDNLLTYIKEKAKPLMERSQVAPSGSSLKEYTKKRTSMHALLNESEHSPRLTMLSQRIGYLTGLNPSWTKRPMTNAFQIVVYATGGYFNIHLDSLNDVELGGGTAFTSAGVAVPPVKGSAVFWFNTKHNGEIDTRARHGGCPVLLGEKWIATKWIHNNLNIFRRKCSLNKDD